MSPDGSVTKCNLWVAAVPPIETHRLTAKRLAAPGLPESLATLQPEAIRSLRKETIICPGSVRESNSAAVHRLSSQVNLSNRADAARKHVLKLLRRGKPGRAHSRVSETTFIAGRLISYCRLTNQASELQSYQLVVWHVLSVAKFSLIFTDGIGQRRNAKAGETGDLRENPPETVASSGTIPTCENPGATPPPPPPIRAYLKRCLYYADPNPRAQAKWLTLNYNAFRMQMRGRGGVVARLLTSHRGEPGSIPAGSRSRNLRMRESWRTIPLVGGFLGDLPFTPPLLSGVAPYSLRFTLIGSQDLDYHDCQPRTPLVHNRVSRNSTTIANRARRLCTIEYREIVPRLPTAHAACAQSSIAKQYHDCQPRTPLVHNRVSRNSTTIANRARRLCTIEYRETVPRLPTTHAACAQSSISK
ncbi:hypothetical protein PR048_031222 [Dryococelus australis]|uniref:Uncharacterized protein n=1 Tax=Dryococelus australis TaxID=614101 RepID=A0ABQ9G8R4_9NEOP|nr:hypothetical protein PR048_031222 [Dryococelus australis]